MNVCYSTLNHIICHVYKCNLIIYSAHSSHVSDLIFSLSVSATEQNKTLYSYIYYIHSFTNQ